ncbi:lasso peptide biosynthesis PqqD family chaperone [Streptomyces longisporoflavus]|uniref:Lasso peptide biosynthesis PqqD family chaperone n=1 Tax=Streptomyces longisporoflavus TaxID=28044 RepID=A0ABW7R333_9ACTN
MSHQLRADVTCCDTDDGLVLLDGRRGRYWQLNTTGATILHALLDGATPQHIARQLSQKLPVTPQQATHDVDHLIDQLTHAQLLQQEAVT